MVTKAKEDHPSAICEEIIEIMGNKVLAVNVKELQ